MNYKKIAPIFIFSALALSGLSALAAANASLFLFPTKGTYPIGEVFTVDVNINTNGEKISTSEGKINFNNEELEVVGISTAGSVLDNWDEEPSFSNGEGIVKFAGLTKAGYIGESGKILSINFKALKNKQSTVRFATGAAVIAADGLGTNILTSMDAGQYELTPKEVIPTLDSTTTAAPEASSTPVAPAVPVVVPFEIRSSTQPDQSRYYATTTASFDWTWDKDISSVAFSLDDKPTSTPKKVSTKEVASKTYAKLSEGVSYFHFLMKTKTGSTTLTHYRIGVDTIVPELFTITAAPITDAYGFTFDASDSGSGIEKYSVRVDDGREDSWIDDGSHVYRPGGLTSGTHMLHAKAMDFAGNFIEQTFSFTVAVVEKPIFVEKIKSISLGEKLVLRFRAPADAKVKVIVEKEGMDKQEGWAAKESDGTFSYIVTEKAEEGIYVVSAVSNIKGVDSVPTEKIEIESKGGIVLFAKKALGFLVAWAPKIFFPVLALFILLFVWSKMKKSGAPKRTYNAPSRVSMPAPAQHLRQNPMSEVRQSAPQPQTQHRPIRVVAEPTDNSFQVRIGRKP